MTGPYRQRAKALFCPRCSELLDVFEPGVELCSRCEGVWLAKAVLDVDGARWPSGPSAWWRAELDCPECLLDGNRVVMAARTSSALIIDQCPAHGVWLDRGELARVIAEPDAHGAQALRARFLAVQPTPAQMAERREKWRVEQALRQKAAEAERARLADELARRAAAEDEARRQGEAAAAEARRARLEARIATIREAEAQHREQQARVEAERVAAETADAQARRAEAERARVTAAATTPQERADALARHRYQLERERRELATNVIARLESELAAAETRARTLRVELAEARARLDALDRQLHALE